MKLGIRSAGVLLHPTSLPGPHGIGDLGPQAHRFAEIIAGCKQSWWQMLPIVPPGAGNSPYNAFSAFAGNPMLLSLHRLAEEGYLEAGDLTAPKSPADDRVDFSAVERFKMPRLRKVFAAFEKALSRALLRDFENFRAQNVHWLEDYALFEALRLAHNGSPWTQWEADVRSRRPRALALARRDLDNEIKFQFFLQHQFFRQWQALRQYCQSLGIGLIGDIPIFVAHNSADVWAHQELFWLDNAGKPLKVAGVPPDYFSKTGQLWGNPLYRWNAMRKNNFAWWLARFRSIGEKFDAVRLDHFIGFHNYWEIPGGSLTAQRGRWVLSPGKELFTLVKKKLGHLQIIAEDLGVVTPQVKALRDFFNFPGLCVLQMAFGTDLEADNYKPHNHPRNCLVYTGTHDNDTTSGWFNDKGLITSTRTKEEIEKEHINIRRYLGVDGREIHWDMIRLAFMSVAHTAVIPVQDLLGLGSQGRMNLPGTAKGNWSWRLKEGVLTKDILSRWTELTETYGRASCFSNRRKVGVMAAATKISTPPKATT
ncbi:MAG: 4-alpha-glucanotransferase [Elusimicrobia bacterium]|nr:4-alpha-glucanotransferase [Elusimicrobiota bacterium]